MQNLQTTQILHNMDILTKRNIYTLNVCFFFLFAKPSVCFVRAPSYLQWSEMQKKKDRRAWGQKWQLLASWVVGVEEEEVDLEDEKFERMREWERS